MQPPEAGEGWVAQVIYLGSVGLAGLFAWVSQYRRGHYAEEKDAPLRHVILESAEIADMHAVRAINPLLTRIADQLQQTFQVVQDNHRIVEDNHRIVEQNREMLVILQRLQRSIDVQEEVKERERRRLLDDFLEQQDHVKREGR